MQEFICIKTCFWLSLINEGQIISVEDENEIPSAVRPFFENKEKVETAKAETKQNEVDEIEKIRAELDTLGKPYDRRWSTAKLNEALTLAKRDM